MTIGQRGLQLAAVQLAELYLKEAAEREWRRYRVTTGAEQKDSNSMLSILTSDVRCNPPNHWYI